MTDKLPEPYVTLAGTYVTGQIVYSLVAPEGWELVNLGGAWDHEKLCTKLIALQKKEPRMWKHHHVKLEDKDG
jgi:hypothetical protein